MKAQTAIRSRPRATMGELSLAYRAFLGDGDARARSERLLPSLYDPFRRRFGEALETLTFAEFVERNRSRVDLYEAPPWDSAATARDA